MKKSIQCAAPATVANLSCGFDVMGLCVAGPSDEAIITLSDKPGVRITKITGDQGKLPYSPEENTLGKALLSYVEAIDYTKGVEVELHKKIPFGSGLGSSASSAVVGVFGLNELLGNPLPRIDLLPHVLEGERIASGGIHADNVAPCLLGGVVLIRSYEPLEVLKLSYPKNLYCVTVHPHVKVETKTAREILPKEIPMKTGIKQWGNVGSLVHALSIGDFALMGRSLTDAVAEPFRSSLIPHFEKAKKAALDMGAYGFGISGSGPTVFAMTDNEQSARKIMSAMVNAFVANGTPADGYYSVVNEHGPTCS